jgi:hypothetical protein
MDIRATKYESRIVHLRDISYLSIIVEPWHDFAFLGRLFWWSFVSLRFSLFK